MAIIAALDPNSDGGDILIRFLLYLMLESFGFSMFVYHLLGSKRRKRILDEYCRDGTVLNGVLQRHQITSHRVNFVENRQTHELVYRYQYIDEEAQEATTYKKIVRKVYLCPLCRCAKPWQARPGTSIIPLRRLPLQPGSGYPTHLLDEEANLLELGVGVSMLSSVAIIIGIPYMLIGPAQDPLEVVALGTIWCGVAGAMAGKLKTENWEKAVLQGEVVASQPYVRNEEESLPQAKELLPEATAVLVDLEAESEETASSSKEEELTSMTTANPIV